ncbi:MAG: putative undecaprenyl-phosphate N-acetylglucosaminyl 1-phosphate transferase [Phycisphaerae bacterium]|nr:putative undecaprenyl-phosphate N-acetylglucosaminyl 1-phosphate transferase [Phycisphaerae bacterium]
MVIPLTVACAVALGLGLLLTPLMARLALRLGITDKPDSLLKPHQKPMPYLGGAAFYLAWAGGVAVLAIGWPGLASGRLWLVLGAGAGVLALGLLDDARGLGPKPRVVVEVAAAVVLYVGGVRFVAIPGLSPTGWAVWLPGLALQIALVLGACNATNLLDGLDGLCGSVAAIALIGLAALAAGALGATQAEGMDGRLTVVVVMALPLAAAVIGFLVYNWRPASLFMGDAGSLLLGFTVAAIGALLSGPGVGGLHLGLSGLVIFILPIADTGLAFYRRSRSGRPLFEGDRSHFYDQLVDRGFSVTQSVRTCMMLAMVFALVGWVGGVLLSFGWAMGLYVVTLGATAWCLHRFGFTRLERAPAPPGSQPASSFKGSR